MALAPAGLLSVGTAVIGVGLLAVHSRPGGAPGSVLLLAAVAVATVAGAVRIVQLTRRSEALAAANAELTARSAEADRANQAKSRFLASMSHELRTPLNAIIGFAELMHDERIGTVSEDHRACLDDIRAGARHLLHLVDESLDLARIEAGRIRLDVQPVDPADVVEECVDSMRWLAAEADLEIALEAQSVGVVWLDPARLRQVILNFLSNAIKFTPPAGSIRVSVARTDEELVIEVADTGPGIAPADQQRVFGEFEQLGSGRGSGTGLGLSVTRRIVEAQNGTVGVHSSPGRGSTFYARLPLLSADSCGHAPEPATPIAITLETTRV